MRRFSFRPALEFRGRKFKGLRGFEGKPFHPPLTDVTVGAYTIAPILDIVSFLFKDSSWAENAHVAAGYVLLVGAVSSLATVLTGFADWLNTQKGTQVRRMANAHAWTMIAMTVFVLINLWYRNFAEGGEYYAEPDTFGTLLSLAILGLVTLGGTIGGSLVYDWGFNVETAKDSPVWHPNEHDVIHPSDISSDDQ
ncbi:MAG: DUF2231 domain-containing protein [Actinomycetota bacterium]